MIENRKSAFGIILAVFFLCGFTTALNSILNPFFQKQFNLSYTEAAFLPLSFYLAYFLISPLAGYIFKNSYVAGIQFSLFLGGLGMGLMAYAATFAAILGSIFIQGGAIAILQVTANPYVFYLGEVKSAPSRLLFAQAFISLGMVISPYLGSILLLSEREASVASSVMIIPYVAQSLMWLLLLGITKVVKMPKEQVDQEESDEPKLSPLKDRALILGIAAIALCVGVEATIANFLVTYLADPAVMGISLSTAGHLSVIFWMAFLGGRFVGSFLLRFVSPEKLLVYHGFAGMTVAAAAIATSGIVAAASVLLLGFCTSNLFPLVFSLVLSKTRCCKTQASSFLCMANIGGAIIPLIQGQVADTIGLQSSFVIPFLVYCALIGYVKLQKQKEIDGLPILRRYSD